MARLEDMSNEALCAAGTTAAKGELTKRGNTWVDSKTVFRMVKGSQLYGYATISPNDDVKVQNGKVVEVNGNPYP